MSTSRRELVAGFAVALRDARRSAGLSQEALAHAAGLDRTYISQLERGLKSPSLSAIGALAAAVGRQPFELVKAAEEVEPRGDDAS